jgi:hypothetical protein
MTDAEKLKVIRAHAIENYEVDGWDIVYECYDDADLLALLMFCDTPASCIEQIYRDIAPYNAYRHDIRGEIF